MWSIDQIAHENFSKIWESSHSASQFVPWEFAVNHGENHNAVENGMQEKEESKSGV